jgi:thiamine phosphate phosphatase / amino-HMP aminohydrolase
MPSSAKSVFILDFDGTITTKDTISALFQAAVGSHAAHGNGKSMSEALLNIQTQYAKDFSNHLDSWIHSKPEDARAVQEVITYQQCLKPVEIMSFNRVSTSGIFEGIGTDIWRELGVAARKTMDKVSVRPGFEEYANVFSFYFWELS